MKEILAILVAWGPIGVFVFAILDGVGVPSPGGLDWLLVLLSANRPEMAYRFAGTAILGSLVGGAGLYYIARRAGEAMLEKYRSRPRFARFERWFQHYGLLTIFIPALIPIPMPLKFFVICAGAFGVSPLAFFLAMLLARIPRYLGLAYLGSHLGHDAFSWLRAHLWHMLGIAAALFAIFYVAIRVMDARRGVSATK